MRAGPSHRALGGHYGWNIEEFHKAQKTGCRIEDMRFTTTARLGPAIALLSIVALTLLNLREASRRGDARTRRADTLLCAEYVEVLSLKRYGGVRVDLTVSEFFLALARLGGHQNRKCHGHPGWLVLWRGWMKLQAMLDGYLAAQRKICGKTEGHDPAYASGLCNSPEVEEVARVDGGVPGRAPK